VRRRSVRAKPQASFSTFREYADRLLQMEKGFVPLKRGASVRMVLVYPNRYSVGMSSLGFQTVYHSFNQLPEIRCERAFLYENPFDANPRTLESGEQLNQFEFIGFSLSYELDQLNLLKILIKSRIPVLARDRKERDPILFLGGTVAGLNPSPLLPFVDGLLVGEGEGLFHLIGDTLYNCRIKRIGRADRLSALGEIDGVFIPGIHSRVKRAVVPDLGRFQTYTPIVTPKSHFGNMFIVEVARGCPRSCFFCAGQKVSHPYRFRSAESIKRTVVEHNPGSHRIGLEGAGLSDYPQLDDLCQYLIEQDYEIAFSSIRPDRVKSDLMRFLEGGNVRSFTMAPEAGSQSLRKDIGKSIKDSELREAVHYLSHSSVKILKLYYIIGLPGETEHDIYQIVESARELTEIFRSYNRTKQVRLSVNAFIPKPFTEFQREAMNTPAQLSLKRKIIKSGLKGEKGITINPRSVREEILQGVLSLGDEQVGLAMLDVVEKGIPWKKAMIDHGLDIDTMIHQERALDASLPWDFICSTFYLEKDKCPEC
jgi:radical SAM superfamily enzyme YgiQ (UPF0313 family)